MSSRAPRAVVVHLSVPEPPAARAAGPHLSRRRRSHLAEQLAGELARELLGPGVDVRILRSATGAPVVRTADPRAAVSVSWSHGAADVSIVACVGAEVGIDRGDGAGPPSRAASSAEAIAAWCAYEASAKLAGTGIATVAQVRAAPVLERCDVSVAVPCVLALSAAASVEVRYAAARAPSSAAGGSIAPAIATGPSAR